MLFARSRNGAVHFLEFSMDPRLVQPNVRGEAPRSGMGRGSDDRPLALERPLPLGLASTEGLGVAGRGPCAATSGLAHGGCFYRPSEYREDVPVVRSLDCADWKDPSEVSILGPKSGAMLVRRWRG